MADPKNNLKLTEEQASKIMQDILKGLSLIHDKDYIHRDLKPDNILLSITEEGNGRVSYTAKIADFGLSAECKLNVY